MFSKPNGPKKNANANVDERNRPGLLYDHILLDLDDDCADWYMDICHFWDDNYFHLPFDDSTPPYEENIC